MQGTFDLIELALLILRKRHLVFPSRERTAAPRSYPGAARPRGHAPTGPHVAG
jgi:hypothetical protein